MRHALYANNARVDPKGYKTQSIFSQQFAKKSGKHCRKHTSSLGDRVRLLLAQYKDDENTQSEIIGKINMYRVNVTIARECRD